MGCTRAVKTMRMGKNKELEMATFSSSRNEKKDCQSQVLLYLQV